MAKVANFIIDNASGQQVREDIEACLLALQSSNSHGSDLVASQCVAGMLFLHTGDNELKVRNSGNSDFSKIGNINQDHLGLLPRSGGTSFPMTGKLFLDSSTGSDASTPALSFHNDADTGLFRSDANTIGISTGGLTRVLISNSGLDMSNGLPIRFQDSDGNPYVALKSPATLAANRTFSLPDTTGSPDQVLAVKNTNHSATNAELTFITVNGVPVGAVFCVAKNGHSTSSGVPDGYLECDGSSKLKSQYQALYAVIGITYGGDAGATGSFNLPDLRGKFVRGFDNGAGVDSDRVTAGDGIGTNQASANKSHNHTATSAVNDPGHRHLPENYSANSSQANGHGIPVNDRIIGNYGSGSGNGLGPLGNRHFMETTTTGITVTTTNANEGASDARPVNVSMMYIIKI